jgi:hypothetical protein
MRQVTKLNRSSVATKATVDSLIAEATSSKFTLSDEQVEQVKILLAHNDACDSMKRKVPLIKAWNFLKQHYGLKMGSHMFERLICERLKRTSWGSK